MSLRGKNRGIRDMWGKVKGVRGKGLKGVDVVALAR